MPRRSDIGTRMSTDFSTACRRIVERACGRIAHTGDRASMNARSPTERLDDIIMGEIGSTHVMKYLVDRGRRVIAYDEIRDDDYIHPDPGWDLVVGDSLNGWLFFWEDPMLPPSDCTTLSVKASRMPKADDDDIDTVVSRRDFKVLVTSNHIERDLTADYEVQVYFPLKLSTFDLVEDKVLDFKDVDMVLERLRIRSRYSTAHIVGFASREAIVGYSRGLESKGEPLHWTSHHSGSSKKMWRAPLRLGKLPYSATSHQEL